MRATASGSAYSAPPLRSSIDNPETPASAAMATFAPTPAAASEKPASKSALTGRSVAAQTVRMFCNVSSRDSERSLRPMDAERPALVVAIAPKPSFSSWRISPTLQAFGMTKNSECIDLKRWRADFRSFMAKSSRLGLIALTRRHPATSRGVSWEWYRYLRRRPRTLGQSMFRGGARPSTLTTPHASKSWISYFGRSRRRAEATSPMSACSEHRSFART
jgi:hypothetical protein